MLPVLGGVRQRCDRSRGTDPHTCPGQVTLRLTPFLQRPLRLPPSAPQPNTENRCILHCRHLLASSPACHGECYTATSTQGTYSTNIMATQSLFPLRVWLPHPSTCGTRQQNSKSHPKTYPRHPLPLPLRLRLPHINFLPSWKSMPPASVQPTAPKGSLQRKQRATALRA